MEIYQVLHFLLCTPFPASRFPGCHTLSELLATALCAVRANHAKVAIKIAFQWSDTPSPLPIRLKWWNIRSMTANALTNWVAACVSAGGPRFSIAQLQNCACLYSKLILGSVDDKIIGAALTKWESWKPPTATTTKQFHWNIEGKLKSPVVDYELSRNYQNLYLQIMDTYGPDNYRNEAPRSPQKKWKYMNPVVIIKYHL